MCLIRTLDYAYNCTTQLSFLLDLGAGHVQFKITNNPRPNCTPILGALGDLGGYIISDTRALTYRTLAPDRGPRGLGNIGILGS